MNRLPPTFYTSVGNRADDLVNSLAGHIRCLFARARDANPAQLTYWIAAWPERIKNLYRACEKLMSAQDGAAVPAPRQAADADAPLEGVRGARDDAISAIDEARRTQMAALAFRSRQRWRWPGWTGNGAG